MKMSKMQNQNRGQSKVRNRNRDVMLELTGTALIFSVLPTILVVVGKLYSPIELFIVFLAYAIIIMLFGYIFYISLEKRMRQQMKALVKMEGIISGELILVNTEEKLKNVLSLEFERCLKFEAESSVIFFDIDELGLINEKYGYNTGDQIIIEIILSTKRFIAESSNLQKSGAILARVKGDTFAVVMPNITEKTAYNEAEKMKVNIETLRLGIKESITCRFAVLSMAQWMSEDKFLDLAYEKLNLAKDYGRGVII